MKREMGIGTAFVMISSIINVALSYVINVSLARYLGAAMFGIIGVITSLYQINRAFLHSGIPKAISKYLPEQNSDEGAIMKSAAVLQLLVTIMMVLLYIVFSKQIAALLRDLSLRIYVFYLGIIVVPLSLFYFYVDGYLNGRRYFKQEAMAVILSSLLRLIFTFLFVFIGLEVFGVLWGYFTSLAVSVLVSVLLFGLPKFLARGNFPKKKLLYFALPVVGSSLALIFMRNLDTLMIKSLLMDNTIVGYYTAAMTLSNVPYIIFSTLSLTLLPSIAKATSEKNVELTTRYITQSMRYLMLGILPVTALIAATAKELIVFMYSAEYAAGGIALSILTLSTMFLVSFLTCSSIILGSGRPKMAFLLTSIGTAILMAGGLLFIPSLGMKGAALASLSASVTAFALGLGYVLKEFRCFMSVKSLITILCGSGIIYFLARWLHPSGFWLLLYYSLLLVFYLLFLYMLKEIKNEDLELVQNLYKRILMKDKMRENL